MWEIEFRGLRDPNKKAAKEGCGIWHLTWDIIHSTFIHGVPTVCVLGPTDEASVEPSLGAYRLAGESPPTVHA